MTPGKQQERTNKEVGHSQARSLKCEGMSCTPFLFLGQQLSNLRKALVGCGL